MFDFFKMPSGGNRPGAGRPKRAVRFARPIAQAERRIADKLPHLIDKMLELADGVMVEEQTIAGPVVYQRAPDRTAIQYLTDRIMGKPTERGEMDLNVDALRVTVKFDDASARD